MSNSIKLKKFHFIYKTTNLLNNKFYIGMHSTSNLKDGYLGSGKSLRYAIRKYGEENFKIEIIEWCKNREILIQKEKEIITEEYVNDVNCYNMKLGGSGGFINQKHQFKCSQAAGIKHRERMLNDEEYRKKISQQTSESNKRRYVRGDIKSWKDTFNWTGKKHSEFGTCWVTNGTENKKIKPTELESYLNNGWKKGVKSKIKGELVITSKLTNSDVIKIKQLISEGTLSSIKISNQFNVAPQTIDKIKRGLTWTHITI
jgi:hypothetical protein